MENVTKRKGERGQGGSETWRWVNRRWVEDWIWGVSASELQNLAWEEKGRKECSYFSSKNCQQRVDWFSHVPPLHVFCHLFCLDFTKILNLQDRFSQRMPHKILPYHSEFQTQSLLVHLECFPAWLRGVSASVLPGPEPVCVWADPVSPCQKGLTDDNLCEPIFLLLLGQSAWVKLSSPNITSWQKRYWRYDNTVVKIWLWHRAHLNLNHNTAT